MSDKDLIGKIEEAHNEELNRQRNILKKILDEYGWIMSDRDVDTLLDIIEDFNDRVEE